MRDPAALARPGAGARRAAPDHVRAWFNAAVEASEPIVDGTLASEREAAETYRRMAKADNTRRAYRAAVRAWCAWCARHDLPPLPASGQDVAAFLAGERGRKLSPETLKLRRAAIRYLHRAAGCPVPTDDVCVSETMAASAATPPEKGIVPRKKVAATATILRRLLAPIGGDVRGLRDRALLLVGFAGALRRSELAAIRFEHLERTDRGIRLTLPQTKGEQTDAVTVPLPYGDTELCPVHALEACRQAAGLTEGPIFRRIWLPPRRGRRQHASPLPCPGSAPKRSARRPWRKSSKRAPWPPVLADAISAATASNAARSPQAWIAVSIRPN